MWMAHHCISLCLGTRHVSSLLWLKAWLDVPEPSQPQPWENRSLAMLNRHHWLKQGCSAFMSPFVGRICSERGSQVKNCRCAFNNIKSSHLLEICTCCIILYLITICKQQKCWWARGLVIVTSPSKDCHLLLQVQNAVACLLTSLRDHDSFYTCPANSILAPYKVADWFC